MRNERDTFYKGERATGRHLYRDTHRDRGRMYEEIQRDRERGREKREIERAAGMRGRETHTEDISEKYRDR